MKILAFVDLHGDLKTLKKVIRKASKEKVDYILCAGDITVFSHELEFLLSEMNTSPCPVLMIHGNHEEAGEMESACSLFKNITFMHDKTLRDGDVVFVCHGGGGFSMKDLQFERAMPELRKKIKKGDKVVLMTHAPPANTELDFIYEDHVGSRPIKKFITEVKPVLAISGHLHENEGVVQRSGKILMANPGPEGMVFEV